MSTQPWYTTREIVKLALDVKAAAQADWQIDDAIEAASRLIEQRTHRVFYPWTGTRYLDWPDPQNGTSYVLWLEENEAISVSALASGVDAITASAYNLEPSSHGPPFDRIELKLSGSGSFGQSSTHQRDVAVTGVFGYQNDENAVGTLSAAVTTTTADTLSVSAPQRIGIGSLLRIDDEHLLVTDRSWVDSGKTLAGGLAAQNNATSALVSDGTAFHSGEVIVVGSEYMRVRAVVGNTLIVERAWDGSVLALHATSDPVYRSTSLTVERGSCGTTATTHLINAPIALHQAPGPIRALCRAQAIDTMLQEQGGYARSVGSGDNARNASGAALANLWDQVEESYRRIRIGAV
jgi:hypothetical protein